MHALPAAAERSTAYSTHVTVSVVRAGDRSGRGRITGVGSGSPRTPASRFAAAMAAILPRVAREADAMCGTIRQLSSADQRVVHRDRLGIRDVQRRGGDDAVAQRVGQGRAGR